MKQVNQLYNYYFMPNLINIIWPKQRDEKGLERTRIKENKERKKKQFLF